VNIIQWAQSAIVAIRDITVLQREAPVKIAKNALVHFQSTTTTSVRVVSLTILLILTADMCVHNVPKDTQEITAKGKKRIYPG